MVSVMIDPKELANTLDKIGAYGDIVTVHVTILQMGLIVAALRAYESPCEHVWDKKDDGRTWWWASDARRWVRRCAKCGGVDSHVTLVPVEEAP